MKILTFDRLNTQWGRELEEALAADIPCAAAAVGCSVITDSATLRPHEPLFVPDYARGWMLEVQPAITVERLGKWIAPRFAKRYFGDFLLCVRLVTPEGAMPGNALELNADGALALGMRVPVAVVADSGSPVCVEATLTPGDAAPLTLDLAWEDLHAEELLALASRYMTMKTGDIIIPCRTALRFPASVGTRLTVTCSGFDAPAVNLKIK